jgi:hypothetical protein
MVSLGNYTTDGTDIYNGRLQFNTQTSATDASAGTVLDFAWNNPNTTFLNADLRVTSSADNSTTYRRFHYNGTRQQLQNDFTDWTTTTWRTTLSFNGRFSQGGKIRNALMRIFEEPSKEIKKQMSKQEKKLLTAKRKSEKLLKQFLSAKEYNSLKLHGELAIPSKMDSDVIFIVKKDPNQMVDVKKKGTYSHKLCAVAEDLEMPVGDQLLSKVMLIKTDEKKFREVAIKHG